jgi:hypothetical protein
MPTEHWY